MPLLKLEYEIETHHAYLSLFLSKKVGPARWIGALRLLTSLSIAAALLTLYLSYDLPHNDGSCNRRVTQVSYPPTRTRTRNRTLFLT